jgi:hypothetical protein
MQMSQTLLNEALNDEAIEIPRNHQLRELSRMTDAIYLYRALPDRSDQDYEEICRTMATDGILPLLDGNLRLLADAAAASLCAPLDHKLESVSPFHHWTRDDPYEAVAAIDAMLQKHFRIPVFPATGRWILASSI